MNKPIYTLNQIASQLTIEGHTMDLKPGNVVTYNISNLNDAGRLFARAAFSAWEQVIDVTFEEVFSDSAKITFFHEHPDYTDEEAVAYALNNFSTKTEIIDSSEIVISEAWIQRDWRMERGQVSVDYASYSLQTFIHEIGHSLGLDHPGEYNGTATYETDAIFANDSWQMTIMSYFSQRENTFIGDSTAYVLTPMIGDILAAQSLYGAPKSTAIGDTVYGFSETFDGYRGDLKWGADTHPFALTVFDSSGDDTFNYSQTSHNQMITLQSEGISDVVGLTGNLVLARDVVIENAFSGRGDDIVIGNDVSNHLNGGRGNDELEARGGNDVLVDALGNDTLKGEKGHDHIWALTGMNTLQGGFGNDFIQGGLHSDILEGGSGDDVLQGDTSRGALGSADRLISGKGDDVLMGGAGRDTFVFSQHDGHNQIGSFSKSDVIFSSETGYSVSKLRADFEVGFDRIELQSVNGLTKDNLLESFEETSQGAVLSFEGTQITFVGLDKADLNLDDFIFS